MRVKERAKLLQDKSKLHFFLSFLFVFLFWFWVYFLIFRIPIYCLLFYLFLFIFTFFFTIHLYIDYHLACLFTDCNMRVLLINSELLLQNSKWKGRNFRLHNSIFSPPLCNWHHIFYLCLNYECHENIFCCCFKPSAVHGRNFKKKTIRSSLGFAHVFTVSQILCPFLWCWTPSAVISLSWSSIM